MTIEENRDTFVFILCTYHISRKPHISLTLLKSQKAFQCTSSLSGQIRIEVILKLGQFRAEVLKNVSNRLLFAPFRDLALLLSFEYLFRHTILWVRLCKFGNNPRSHCKTCFENPHFKKPRVLTVLAPIKAADTIQKLFFEPQGYHIKNA